MKINRNLCYLLTALSVFLFDRLTKCYALTNFVKAHKVTDFLSFQLVFNRGVSWGLFNSADSITFFIVTALVILVTAYLIWYSHSCFKQGKNILGQILVISGSISNLVDRFIYLAVIDFIYFHWKEWHFAVFNVADCAVVIGVFIMFLYLIKEDYELSAI